MKSKLYTLDNKFIKETTFCPSNFTGIVEWPNGTKDWHSEGKLHRLDGPAIEYNNGTKYWILEGEWHRLDGPAYEDVNGSKEWWVNNKRHRLDGPAIEYSDGTKSWWVYDKQVTEEKCKLLHSIMKLKGLL